MPELNGLQTAELLRTRQPAIKIVVLTANEDESYLNLLCKAGVAGYVLKRSPGEELVQAIRMAAQGRVYFDPILASKALARQMAGSTAGQEPNQTQLSGQEKAVLSLIAWGYSNKEVAERLNVSVKTIETYRVRIAAKLGLRSRSQLVKYAMQQGWLNDSGATPLPAG
jgi:DNA-binding NarL/FixJ family response regulator